MKKDLHLSESEFRKIPRVSIGVPVYNGEKYIAQALDALRAQTYTDFELLISDNGSTDKTQEIAQSYAQKDSRIRYIRQSENQGAIANFLFLLDQAKGEFFMWAAADDLRLPEFIAECVHLLEKDASIGFAVTRYAVVSCLSPLFSLRNLPDIDCITEEDPQRRVFRYSQMPFTTHKDNLVYGLWRRKILRSVLTEIEQSPIGKVLLGDAMNEYVLAHYKGGFVPKTLFHKRYRFLPPGHFLEPFFNKTQKLFYKFFPTLKHPGGPASASVDRFLTELRIVLQISGFDKAFIRKVLDANKTHLEIKPWILPLRFILRLATQLGLDPLQMFRTLTSLPGYFWNFYQFKRKYGEALEMLPSFENPHETILLPKEAWGVDLLVARRIFHANPAKHVHLGPRREGLVSYLAAFREVEIIDSGLSETALPDVLVKKADILHPEAWMNHYADSVSCLHTLESSGLGRAGEPIDPQRFDQTFTAMTKLVKASGRFYVSLTIGIPRIEFNTRRIVDPLVFTQKAGELGFQLEELLVIQKGGKLESFRPTPEKLWDLASQREAIGIFIFQKS